MTRQRLVSILADNIQKFIEGNPVNVVSCLFSPDSPVRTAVIIVGIIMVCIGWYKKSKSDKKVFQYMKEQDEMNFSNQQS